MECGKVAWISRADFNIVSDGLREVRAGDGIARGERNIGGDRAGNRRGYGERIGCGDELLAGIGAENV